MKKTAVIVIFLFIGLIASTVISGNELKVGKEVETVAKGEATQINSPLRMKDEISRTNSPIIPHEKRWSRIFGRLLYNEIGYSVQPTNDGGYILVATAYYETGGIWLIKVNANGIKEWDKKFGGWDISGKCVQQTKDKGYIIAGITSGDVWLIKTDSNGNEEWNNVFGGPDDEWMWGDRLVQQTNDGGYIITAATHSYGAGSSDVWLIKTDENGNEQWNKTFGGEKHDFGASVQQTNDGRYIIAGATYSYGSGRCNAWVIKSDKNGIEEWNKTFGGHRGFSVQQTNDGGYIMGGYGGWMVKMNVNGNEEWNKTFCQSGWWVCYSIQQTSDGGYIMAGTSGDMFWDADLYLIKTNVNGNLEWNKKFGKPRYCEMGNCVRQTNDGGYIIVGTKQRFSVYIMESPLFLDVWLIKTDQRGNARNFELGIYNSSLF